MEPEMNRSALRLSCASVNNVSVLPVNVQVRGRVLRFPRSLEGAPAAPVVHMWKGRSWLLIDSKSRSTGREPAARA
jgi:hypothetical protein